MREKPTARNYFPTLLLFFNLNKSGRLHLKNLETSERNVPFSLYVDTVYVIITKQKVNKLNDNLAQKFAVI